jgi:hypothetical protein
MDAPKDTSGAPEGGGSETGPLTGFGYSPSNFVPAAYASDVPPAGTTVDCNMTYTSPGMPGPATWCGGRGPYVIPNVSQPGGPNVDILVFASLAIASGNTLKLQGSNPVILAVYGDATVAGTIDASGGSGSQGPTGSGTGNPGTPGAGGNWNCATSTGATPPFARPGGGGGGMASIGGAGGNTGDPAGAGGAARGTTIAVPLLGGCPGGNSGTECQSSGGAGGGAVQLSAAGALVLTGGINASGGAGGAGRQEGTGSGECHQGVGSYTGGAGGGSAGDILLEGMGVSGGTLTATGGAGGANGNGGGSGSGGTATVKGVAGTSPTAGNNGGDNNNGGGGGGGAGGYVMVNAH